MSQLVRFYRGEGTDSEGRLLHEIWAWSDNDLEDVHDFIQWLFPLPERSQFNPDAPLLTADEITAFKNDPLIQAHLRKSFERIIAFLGLAITDKGKLVEGPDFNTRAQYIWASPNHNWLRITRILRSLSLVGREKESVAFYDCLDAFYHSKQFPIPANTYRFWTNASQ